MGTNIEWTEATWNIITGCTKHSEGCKNCYAEKMHKRLTAMKQEKYKEPFEKVVFHSEELNRVLGKNKRVFVNSMSDTFHEQISDIDVGYILTACQVQPFNDFQILTKRAERLPDFKYPENVWLGVTVENANHKDRIEYLKKTNAKIKFLSCEPLLGDLGDLDLKGIDWVIAGGESGPDARPCHPEWLRNIQKQCKEQGVAFFFKQWGTWKLVFERYNEDAYDFEVLYSALTDEMQSKYTRINFAGGYGLHGDNVCYYQKTGKKGAGSKLDGVEYKEYPEKINDTRRVEWRGRNKTEAKVGLIQKSNI